MKPYRYVAGFLFDSALHNVLLIEKQKPEWQVGMLNAIGGKIEGDELPMDAMDREFQEETTCDEPLGWVQFCALNGLDWECFFFAASTGSPLDEIKSRESEQVAVCDSTERADDMIPNLHWLLPMAVGFLKERPAIQPGLSSYAIYEM